MSTETGSRCTSDPESSLAKGTSGHYAGWAELHRTVPDSGRIVTPSTSG